MTEPTKDQINFARRLVAHRTREEIEKRMRKLEAIHKGPGWPMYESLRIVLGERK